MTGNIKTYVSASGLKHGLAKYYKLGSLNITKVNTGSGKHGKLSIYRIKLAYQRDGPSALSIQPIILNKSQKIEVTDPVTLGKVGGPPLKGKFILRCKNAKGQLSQSYPITLTNTDLEI